MRIKKSKVAAALSLGAVALLAGLLALAPSSADTARADGPDSFEAALSNAAPAALGPDAPATCAQNGELQLPSVDGAESGAAAVACVDIWLTPTDRYHCCAGRGWIWCAPY